MSNFTNQFPYSDFHELNIDWVLKQIRANMDEIAYLKEEFDKIEVMTEAQINEMISHAIDTNNVQLYADMANLKATITKEYTDYVTAKVNQLNNNIAQLRVYVDIQDSYYDELAQGYAATALTEAKDYTDNTVLNYTMMINPITGVYEDVRNVVSDIVEYFHTENALTAGEYDALELTAEGYDSYELTAYDYDFNGKVLLV